MILTYPNINKSQVKNILLSSQKKLAERNIPFNFVINDKNPLDQFFDVEIKNKRFYLYFQKVLRKFEN